MESHCLIRGSRFHLEAQHKRIGGLLDVGSNEWVDFLLSVNLLKNVVTGAGMLYLLSNFMTTLTPAQISQPIFIGFSATTLAINWIITGLVVGRLVYFRMRVSHSMGTTYCTPFGRIIAMCVESAALIIVFATVFLVQNLSHSERNPFSVSRIFLTQIYVSCNLLWNSPPIE